MGVEDFLQHFGIKGMKWGIRRNREKAAPSHDAADAAAIREKIKNSGGIHSLTNKELNDFLKRADLERRYSQIMNETPSHKKGHDFLKTALGVGTTINNLYNMYNSPVAKEIRKALEKRKG